MAEMVATRTASVDFRNVCLTYQTGEVSTEALRNISLTIASGEFVAIIGPSGCGKSSLLNLGLGLQKASQGSITIDDVEVTGPRRDVGVVFQAPVLLPWRRIIDNVLLPAAVLGMNRQKAKTTAHALLKTAGLEGFETKYPYELSGGMQQRVGIVRALLHDPDVLLMDEPFAALDALTRETMSLELQRIWMERKKTILFITHNLSEAVLLADRIIVMSARPGRIIEDIRNPAARPRTLEWLSSPEAVDLAHNIRKGLDSSHAING